ncbi:Asp23/Gls24 family envelope stress response protein [Alkaliphilus hydrothermalis]|uniref:Alkaline shock family protein YloU/adenylate kinase family enzyme n=1 Tax=Alkaliphilus hydrothermalis TaxID=1482730 RepID=A0ABS2NR50_9FIRM|nr:Asp23/Gls24 family envelope stress response protein [Alkaliphilus hydrothermalis]MBM7615435.1 putative alkaline shock family protein YloU/adenylate kinase family enzyme [Alkaliphilus hydrothermalis]
MKVYALVGPSGTGKSYQSISLAKKKKIAYIIDDGLLIKGNKLLGGSSAKREKSKMAAVKRALFLKEEHRNQVKEILEAENPKAILLLGTSDKMVNTIAKRLDLGEINDRFYIHDISSEDDIQVARKCRMQEGKHVIPVPTFEIKKDFSGYFLNPLKVLRNFGKSNRQEFDEKSVVRPTFSYMGRYTISDRVVRDLVQYSTLKIEGVHKISDIDIKTLTGGIVIEIELIAIYGYSIKGLLEAVQTSVNSEVEGMTSLNILSINVFLKNLVVP